jgi:hypothetical protein
VVRLVQSASAQNFFQEIPTAEVRRAALRYVRPVVSAELNDPYHGVEDGVRANQVFLQTLARYRSRTLGPILSAVQSDVAYLRSRIVATFGWIAIALGAAGAVLMFTGLTGFAACALVPLVACLGWWREVRILGDDLHDSEEFYACLQGWMVQFKLAEVGNTSARRAVA